MERSPQVTLRLFNEAFNRHDVDAMMALMSPDCLFENTYPPPDGEKVSGQPAMREFWLRFFRSSPQAIIDIEEAFTSGDRGFQRWRYQWEPGGYVRGVDLFRFRDGMIVEKLSYVKG
jgi:predicted SnoaL-like aldol condensation-catalyzing enzyme